MLFYFHFLYSFPFNVISVATVLCFCGFHPPMVSTFPWFPPSHGFHPPVVSTLPWFPPSCGYSVVSTFLWFPPCVVTLWFAPSCHLHLPCGYSWCPFHGLHFCSLHSAMVSTLPWFSSLLGSHPPMVTPWCPFHGLHFHGFHPPMVCIFTWFPPSGWLLCGVSSMVCTFMVYTLPWFPPSHGLHLHVVPTLPVVTPWCPFCGLYMWFTLCRGFHPLMVTPWCPSWILA